jgi:hypothetical protein
MKKIASLSLLSILPAFAQQPKFDIADIHVSTAHPASAQNSGGTLNRIQFIQAAYGVTEDAVASGPSWLKSDVFDVVAGVPEGTTLASSLRKNRYCFSPEPNIAIRRLAGCF